MTKVRIFYGTNRRHERKTKGSTQWKPSGYGNDFSSDGLENLRFGHVDLTVPDKAVSSALAAPSPDGGIGDGLGLMRALESAAAKARITAYRENIDPAVPESKQADLKLGSEESFSCLRDHMLAGGDTLLLVHGYAVGWQDAVRTAASLQLMLNHQALLRPLQVFLFTWPSDGSNLPYAAYRSDRTEARASGVAVARGMLKLRDYLVHLKEEGRTGKLVLCDGRIHLLCHSMGNYVLQNALGVLHEEVGSRALPRIFDHVFLCAGDVDDDVLEPQRPMGTLHQLGSSISVLTNRQDRALSISDWTKGHPARLGTAGPARMHHVHEKIEHIDCTRVVQSNSLDSISEHSYFLGGKPSAEIAALLKSPAETRRERIRQLC